MTGSSEPIEAEVWYSAPIVAILGPTAVGKSSLALELAERHKSKTGQSIEIISADSRQIYRGLDIGTAKPSRAEQAAVRHHLIDLVDPEDDFSVAEFQDQAYLAIGSTLNRGAMPVVVGGTGLYVRAILEGLTFPRVPADSALRYELEDLVQSSGPAALHDQLGRVDPVAALRIDQRNVRRVIRAIEVTLKSGRPFSQATASRPLPNVLRIGLTLDREALYRRIDDRVNQQMAAGLVEETRLVLDRGCPPTRPALSGFGYRQMVEYLAGAIDLDGAVRRYKFETHRFARQQYTWFKLDDPRITWIEAAGELADPALELVQSFYRAVATSAPSS